MTCSSILNQILVGKTIMTNPLSAEEKKKFDFFHRFEVPDYFWLFAPYFDFGISPQAFLSF